jgi:hypothetical protein
MHVIFDPTAAVGRQYTLVLADGGQLAGVSLQTVQGALQASGLSIRKAAAVVAEAKLASVKL